AIELIAAVQAIEHQRIPPTANLNTPDPVCDLDFVPNVAREADVEYVMSNAFGFGGHNTSIIARRWHD
ncbi:beta-ketoacyl-[acyl-carrier-protein] synthase II, partial [Candidatus Poribacteria bacterium]|nr:beta-ketoacyl-[acyl-carrier-protein] synthase II [Candidatus Poribacteria bacterium]